MIRPHRRHCRPTDPPKSEQLRKFAIDSGTGAITIAAGLDYESASSYSLTVEAQDSSGAKGSTTLGITVTDVNEPPAFGTGSDGYNASVPESTATWTSILQLAASDQDSGDTLTYHITSGNSAGKFNIDYYRGDILLMKRLDYDVASIYSLTVEVRDGNGGKATVPVTITVLESS